MKTIRLCPSCLAPLPPDAPDGLCPACLLKSDAPEPEGTEKIEARRCPTPGETFGGYRILRLLGRGGMGEVYEAEHLTSGRRVALKVMGHALASEKDRKRFLREGRLAASVSHPNVVYIYGSEEISGSPVIAMELVSSGTLKDRIKREGPLPPAQAVDAALEIIAGLEAAQGTGVLHRDIKPANCFVGADGTVKVGDFGLSISTIARGESLLTATGSVLGTPAYASPEQLRGEELDVASDIYSVGATLYHLLTGRPPHETTDFVKLITEVLDKTPPSPDKLRSEIPAGLAKVVMRCLVKDRTARFASYAALRDALLPFDSTAPSPAVIGLRFVAGMVDEFVAYLPSLALLVWLGRDAVENVSVRRTLAAALIVVAFLLWDLLYYAVPEGLWGASVGKGICGLRVVGPNRGAAGLPRSLLRSLIFRITWSVPVLVTLLLYTGAEYTKRMTSSHWNPEDWMWFPLLALLFCTMRRRNGFAGLHDLASGTRVVARPVSPQRPKLSSVSSPTPAPLPAGKLGPYEILGSLGPIGSGELLLANDPALRRNLWIHRRPAGTEPLAVRRRDLSRATRLRWLNGERDAQSAWDAYEALDGTPLVKLSPQPWAAVRFWLHDLASEIRAGIEHESLPPALEPDRVWITADNRAVLLDFPCPGLNSTSVSPLIAASRVDDFANAQEFLNAVADHGLSKTKRTATPPEPLHARPFLRSLAEGRFESPEFLIGNLESLLGKMAEVSRRRRLAVIGVALGPALFLALTVGAMFWLTNKRTAHTWPTDFPGSAELRSELRAYDAFRDHPGVEAAGTGAGSEGNDPGKQFRRAFRIHIAGHHRELIENTNFWAHPVVAEALTGGQKRIAEEAIADNPTVNAQRLEEADATLRYLRAAILAADTELPQWAALGGLWAFVLFAVVLDFGCAILLGEGLFLRLLGIATVNRHGDKASRLRLLARTILAWSPCGIGACLSLTMWLVWLPGVGSSVLAIWALGIFTLLIVAATAWAVWRPARSLQDIVVGTWLVPR
ncbi:MAG TPA: protein kinase [Verrucomicrobiae bacterium]|nr:protein kinase [Verrucomicrobiae bacterium]